MKVWDSIFVKPLAFVILWFNKYVNSAALALIITSIIIRLIAYPITKKTAMQSELLKKAHLRTPLTTEILYNLKESGLNVNTEKISVADTCAEIIKAKQINE